MIGSLLETPGAPRRQGRHRQLDLATKSASLYAQLLAAWGVLCIPLTLAVIDQLEHAATEPSPTLLSALVVVNAVFIGYFWLNGIKDIVYVVHHYLVDKRLPSAGVSARRCPINAERVVLLYCTCDDVNEASLAACLHQTHPDVRLVILDDSRDPAMQARVDRFAAEHGASLVRRADHSGFKAGNLNNYLRGRDDYDFFVILDSDEIIPDDFVTRTLDYLAAMPTAGIVQANHIATRNRTPFMRLFARGVDAHWPVYQSVKHRYGFMSLLGHGAIVRRECYEDAGGFPHLVAEDLSFSIEARSRGWFVAFADDVVCEEEYPIDYLAFKKRHSKWTQGNMEFITTYSARIARSPMSWFEKLDIVLFTYNLPLTAVFAIYVVLNVIAFPLLGYHLAFPMWMLIPTVVFLFAPMLNDVIHYARVLPLRTLAWYSLHSFLLYGSMFFVSLSASLRGMLGAKAVFIVTPKESERVGLREAIVHNRRELVFAFTLIVVATITTGWPITVGLIALPSILSVYLTMLTAARKQRSERRPLAAFELVPSWEEFLARLDHDAGAGLPRSSVPDYGSS